jgi:hypothetical protein
MNVCKLTVQYTLGGRSHAPLCGSHSRRRQGFGRVSMDEIASVAKEVAPDVDARHREYSIFEPGGPMINNVRIWPFQG